MGADYRPETCRALAEAFDAAGVLRPRRVERYEPGEELTRRVTAVAPPGEADVRVEIERFVGGGFAGQVYRVRVLSVDGGAIAGLEPGSAVAMKILVPPSPFSRRFRDAIYAAGFQGAFSLQANPDAARAGALWQKLIRRGAKVRFGDERAVVDVLGTFFDEPLGSCGEFSEWIEGRSWRFEVDDRLDLRRRRQGRPDPPDAGSPEYRAKRRFMADLVGLLHEMGAPELARQYEWWTCKSQPNVLKRSDAGDDPAVGLTAVDFRAGLALLPVLPMSPADVALIVKGVGRGSLVQFDRGDLGQLERFIGAHAADFADLADALAELKVADAAYRDSLLDVTHHHVRLLYDGRLWSKILDGAVSGWRARRIVDDPAAAGLKRSRLLTLIFAAVGLLPLVGVAAAVVGLWLILAGGAPVGRGILTALALAILPYAIARLLRRLWGRADYRRHYARMLTSCDYLRRAVRARMAEKLIAWHRAGRLGADAATRALDCPGRFAAHLLLSILPAGVHRMLTDPAFAREKLAYLFVRPVRLYFNADAREQWLRDMLAEGRRRHMLTDEDAGQIKSRIGEPFIQKYLQSLAVHICTLPITQVVSVAVAIWYKVANGLTWAEAWGGMGLILVAFQVTPISPGSLVRGLYVVYLVIRERNIKDYNIAVVLGFFKYVGYLAFPIQMAYRYPALARFMAAHWATGAVHVVPVFGEHGALLEHGVFDQFYNRPLMVRRRMRARAVARDGRPARLWPAAPIALAAVALLAFADRAWVAAAFSPGHAGAGAWAAILLPMALTPLLAAAGVTAWAGGMRLGRRVGLAMICGAAIGAAAGAIAAARFGAVAAAWPALPPGDLTHLAVLQTAWRAFAFALLAAVGALVTEIALPEPDGPADTLA